jgi:NitT/TauT family transport system ATP-binding protein
MAIRESALRLVPESRVDFAGRPVALEAQNLTVSYQDAGQSRTILDELSLSLRNEEFVCVIGPSGCGKTTLVRALAGLVLPASGRIMFGDMPVTAPRRQLAVVFQDYGKALLPWRTVYQNVAFALEARKIHKSEHADRIELLLKQTGLVRYSAYFPHQLSGGLQQRVQIARCLALEPAVLLMDEPFGALDAMTRQVLQDELLRLCAQNRTTALFITHDLEEAIYLSDRVIALAPNPGRIAEVVDIEIPRPRNQLETREDPLFLQYRHHLYNLIESLSK